MATYADFQEESAPRFVRGPNGSIWLRNLGTRKDAFVSRLRESIKARLVKIAPVDALPFIGSERQIDRPVADDDATYRGRLAGAWDTWTKAGTKAGVIAALNAAFFAAVRILENWEIQDSPPVAKWWRFYTIIDQPSQFQPDPWTWDGGFFFDTWDTDEVWDVDATVEDIDALRRTVAKWKSAHAEQEAGVIVFTGGIWGETDGTWNGAGTWDDSSVANWYA